MLWNKEGIPHKGGVCVGMDDLGEDLEEMDADSRRDYYETCEMCEREGIRYVHIMQNPHYHTELRVGQQCAEKMESEYSSAKQREKVLKNRYKRLQNFLKKPWHSNNKCNFTLKYKGYHFTIMKSKFANSGYGVLFLRTYKFEYNGDKKLTLERAKLLAFDMLEEALQRVGQ